MTISFNTLYSYTVSTFINNTVQMYEIVLIPFEKSEVILNEFTDLKEKFFKKCILNILSCTVSNIIA